ncbi:hypothetical protein [Acinetobacter soli]|uniref:Uncharacterized protein n=1 Tax=Acinetobacter soli TaxID=487316 RepID=A0AB38YY10_9GAMM|nr:hypothetical protein [Acinetobacter soli]WND06352.1 hypothetical protein RHP80_04175 [Acinetobacter soli]
MRQQVYALKSIKFQKTSKKLKFRAFKAKYEGFYAKKPINKKFHNRYWQA